MRTLIYFFTLCTLISSVDRKAYGGIQEEADAAESFQSKEFEIADKKLNKVWADLKNKYAKQPTQWKKIQTEERKWLKKRKSDCEDGSETSSFGSLGRAETIKCLKESTNERIQELKKY